MAISRVSRQTAGRVGAALFVWLCFAQSASASSITIELADGSIWAIQTELRAPAPGQASEEFVPFSGFGWILQNKLDPQARWDWDVRTGFLRVIVANQRFTLSSQKRVIAIGSTQRNVRLPIHATESDLWIPIDSFLIMARAIKGVTVRATVLPLTPSEPGAPEETIGEIGPDVTPAPPPLPPITLPPGAGQAWKVVLAPVWNDRPSRVRPASLRESVNAVTDRTALLLAQDPAFAAVRLEDADQPTTDGRVLDAVVREAADMVIFLRFEVSPLAVAPGFIIYYMEESVDSQATRTNQRSLPQFNYLSFQTGNRQLADMLAMRLSEIAVLRQRHVMPAPMYLLKRCPARAAMLVVTFPERSADLARLGEAAFRESIARGLSDAIVNYRRERLETAGERPAARRNKS